MDEKELADPAVTNTGVPEAAPKPNAKTRVKTADRPHPITVTLGLLSPVLALVSLGVSFYVFRGSQQSMHVAQRGYLGFHFESGEIGPTPALRASDPRKYFVRVTVSTRDIGNTPAYVDMVKEQLYAINADDMSKHIGGSEKTSPDFDPLVPKGGALLLPYDSEFADQQLQGDRSVVYRIDVRWHDAFGESQSTEFCQILRWEDDSLPTTGAAKLWPEPCIKGMKIEGPNPQ